MKIGIIIETNEPEKAWNGVRLGNVSLKSGHEVKMFLMSAGVEIAALGDGKYNVKALLEEFAENGGTLLACGTCLKSRNQAESEICPISTMQDCVAMVTWSDKVVTF